MPEPKTLFVALQGTLDLVTPPIAKKPSHAITAENVQPLWGGGFGRIEGYEKVDGGAAPSEHIYYRLIPSDVVTEDMLDGTVEINGKVGIVSAVDVENNSLRVVAVSLIGVSGDAVVITKADTSVINTTLSYLITFGFGENADEQARFLAEAHKLILDNIQAPIGDGVLRGVVDLDGQLIAFRDNAGQLAVSMGNTDRSWSAVPDVYEVLVKAVVAPAALVEGVDVVIGGVTAKIYASVFAADGQTGILYLDKSVAATTGLSVTVAGTQQAQTEGTVSLVQYSAGKAWKFEYHNFYAGSGSRYAYGTNGDQVAEIRPNGIVIPIPIYDTRSVTALEVHKNHLFVAFEGGQYGHCAVGEPLNWEILLGAEQFGTGDEITDLQSMPGGYLLIGCKNSIHVLSGSTRDDWTAYTLTKKIGITAGTLTSSFVPIAHTNNGFIDVTQTEAVGNFIAAEIEANTLLGDDAFIKKYTNFFAHSQKKAHNQIRFYQRGLARHLIIQLLSDGKNRATFFTYPKALEGVWDTNDNTYFAFDDGFIYRQNNDICSFAGEDIYWVLRPAYTHTGSPMDVKSWQSFELQMSSEGSLNLSFTHSLDYGSMEHAQSRSEIQGVFGGGGRWDEAQWDNFFWSSPDYVTPNVYLNGHSKNISILLSGRSNYEKNFRLEGYTLSYIPRRRYRV
ncbi:hypothetical protein ACF8PD_13580 [Vibrio plantisponsor]|uniref:hypothetical protein n=1 Tax=Vibrio plantisponsor TaxID=664643 RepID=UPI00370CAF42